MRNRRWCPAAGWNGSVALALACAALLGGGVAAHAECKERYADEDRDWGVAPSGSLRQPPYHAPTPREIPGAQVVQTCVLQTMLKGPSPPILIDVLSGEGHETLAGAVWLGGAGRGESFSDPLQADLAPLLVRLAADKARPMVFFCASAQCWLSYNAALRAVAAGYTSVHWYRGGIDAWTEAGLPVAKTVATGSLADGP